VIYGQVIPNYEPPAFFGNGYPVIEGCFSPDAYAVGATSGTAYLTVGFLLAILVAKIIGTSLTLGSGGAGGVFAPSLFMGATLGGAFGILAQHLPPFNYITPSTYAMAGMAGVLAGCVHCPLTAFLLVFEITQDYKAIVPVMLVAILATIVSQLLLRDSIYTLALRERGIRMGLFSDLTLLRRLYVGDVPLTRASIVRPHEPVQRLLELAATQTSADFPVVDEQDHYAGLVVGEDIRTTLLQQEAVPLMIVAELVRADVPPVRAHETLEMVLDKFAEYDVASLVVVDRDHHIRGLITRTAVIRHYQQSLASHG